MIKNNFDKAIMELQEIIKNDDDRLFIVDSECFLIFTGDTIEDEKPFIRIGTWADLPARCIPLIENIVITDAHLGNPSNEQFNINPKYTSAIRYIGSKNNVQAYLNFQKIFGIDLSGVTTVDVENDLPTLSHEKVIFNKESIIGIFYHDGNFRIVYNGNNIFDLKEIEKKSYSKIKIHEMLSEENRESNRYSGAGLVLLENSPLFYKNEFFISYQFPKKYFKAFSNLNIDPLQIREIMLPAPNIFNITEYLKWKNSRGARVKIFTDSKDGFGEIRGLFPKIDIARKDFKGLSINTGDGLIIDNYTGTINLNLTCLSVKPSFQDMKIALMKEYSGLYKILEESLDGIFVPYSVYEQATMFLKSAKSPIAVLSDGNKNISKLLGTGTIIIHPGIQYEFRKYDNLDNLLQDATGLIPDKDLVSKIIGTGGEDLNEITFEVPDSAEENPFDRTRKILNTVSVLKIYLNTTTDRKFAQQIKNAAGKVEAMIDRNAITGYDSSRYKINLVFFGGVIYEFIEPFNPVPAGEIAGPDQIMDDPADMLTKSADPEKNARYERIKNDRKRLNDLLELYKKIQDELKKDIRILSTDLAERKKQSDITDIQIDKRGIKKRIMSARLKKIRNIAIIVFSIILLAFLSFMGYQYYHDYQENSRIEQEKTQKEESERKKLEEEKLKTEKQKNDTDALIKKYDIHVSDRDIYVYANRVALKNGYKSIDFHTLKEKNPNWIFPGNVFRMMDGEKVVVKWGDTLWAYSEKKLMYMNIEFYKLIDKIKEAKEAGNDYKSLLIKAKNFAFNDRHYKMLEAVRK